MDWDWKDLGWDPSGSELSNGGASVDLSLGESSDFSEKAKDLPTKDLKSESLPRGSSKRGRTMNGSAQNVRCSVDGCDSDLSDCREYHRRHRVCEKHSKTPIVCVGGKQQRFCQQCSRFHSLGEFDEVKRSCRKRLDGHNRRRRKPQPPSLFMAAEKFLTSYKGPRILHFGSPQTYNAPFFSMWPATGKSGAEPVMISYDQSSLLSSLANVEHQQDKQLPLFGFNSSKAGHCKEAVSGVPLRQATSGAAAPSVSANGGRKVTSDFEPGSIDSNCALYLLSTLQTQGQELSLVQSTMNCPVQSSPLEDLHFDAGDKYSSSCSESPQEKSTNPLLVVDADTTDLHCDHMIHMRPDEIVENGDLPTFPFFWE